MPTHEDKEDSGKVELKTLLMNIRSRYARVGKSRLLLYVNKQSTRGSLRRARELMLEFKTPSKHIAKTRGVLFRGKIDDVVIIDEDPHGLPESY